MLLALAASLAVGQTVPVFVEDFDAYSAAAFSGTAGWVSGDAADAWSTAIGDGVYPLTDEAFGTWGSGESVDNHLVYVDASFGDFVLDVDVRSVDDDAMGVVFRYADAENFYLAFLTSEGAPNTGDGTPRASFVGARIYRIAAGLATELGASSETYATGVTAGMRVVARGADLELWYDADHDGDYVDSERLVTAVDATFAAGAVGLYCYDHGDGSANVCAFDDLVVSLDDVDLDGHPDGAAGGDDCDDSDPSVYPGAPELCDGADDDCDSLVDEGLAIGTWYVDDDGDGYGDPATALVGCAQPAGTVVDGTDCDDSDPNVFPGAAELGDGVDQDCDGQVDEGLDSDGDGLLDPDEVGGGTDPHDADSDDDGLLDGAEAAYGTRPGDPDSDDDGLVDGLEAGVAAAHPDSAGFVPDVDPASTTDPTRGDTDGDGLGDGAEDADHDGAWSGTLGGTGTAGAGETDPTLADTDGDGLDDGEEGALATDPRDTDTDDGSVDDGAEVGRGTDPLDPSDDLVPVIPKDSGTADDSASDTGATDPTTVDTGSLPDPDEETVPTFVGGCACGSVAPGGGWGLAAALGIAAVRRRRSGR